jgi:hypothetical protein
VGKGREKGKERTYELLDVGKEVVKVDERQLSLDVGVLTQVPPRVTFLRPEALLNTEDVSKRRQTRLEVKLRTLSEVRLLTVVVELEEGRTALGLNHAGRGHFEETEGLVRLAEGGEERGADFEDRGSVLTTEDEVAGVGELRGVGVLREKERQLWSASGMRLSGKERTSLTLLRKASSPPGALPTTENQSAESSWLSGAVLPSGSSLMTPVIWTVDSRVRVRAS